MQVLRQSLKPFFQYLFSARYRRLLRVRRVCRRQKPGHVFTVKINGLTIEANDAPSFQHQYEAIYYNRLFHFDAPLLHAPVIWCCGANVGLEIFYFKRQYPRCTIRAYEADPFIAQLLKRNVERHYPKRTEVINAAVWTSTGTITFQADGAMGGKAGSGGQTIPCVRLADELKTVEHIDLLLIDIEGAELEVLRDCREQLHRVERLVVEWHPAQDAPQELPGLLQLLTAAGFRYRLYNIPPEAPFVNRIIENDFDAMVEIYAERIRP